MKIDYLQKALHTFNTNTPNWYGWRKNDDNGNKIPNEQRMFWEHVIVIKEGAVKPTKQELENKIEELKAEYNATQYQRDRAKEYPDFKEYLDGIVKGDQAQIDKYIADCLAIKTKYPKSIL